MSDSPRWHLDGLPGTTGIVEVMLYDDHVAAVAAAEQRVRHERLVDVIFHSPNDGPRAFALVRTTDVSGVSGTGTVAYGVEFPDGTVALRWVGGNPTSVVFHDNGMESVEAIHGHSGATQIMWLSEDLGPRAAEMDECESRGYAKGVDSARDAVAALPWKVAISFGPIDCNQSCEHGPCSCSGVMRPEAWTTGPDDALAAIDGVTPDA